MECEYPINRMTKALLVIPSLLLVFMFILPFWFGKTDEIPEMIGIIAFLTIITGVMIYYTYTCKLVTSSNGIKIISFGRTTTILWENINSIDVNSFGNINLLLERPIVTNSILKAFAKPFGYDRNLQISNFIEDKQSKLLEELKIKIPNSSHDISRLQEKRIEIWYQKPGIIILYYLILLIINIFIAILARRTAEILITSGIANALVISYLFTTSGLIGTLVGGFGLFIYSSSIEQIDISQKAHLARTQYLIPVISFILGLLIGISIVIILHLLAMIVADGDEINFAIIVFLIGGISPFVSTKVERILFRN